MEKKPALALESRSIESPNCIRCKNVLVCQDVYYLGECVGTSRYSDVGRKVGCRLVGFFHIDPTDSTQLKFCPNQGDRRIPLKGEIERAKASLIYIEVFCGVCMRKHATRDHYQYADTLQQAISLPTAKPGYASGQLSSQHAFYLTAFEEP